MWLNNIDCEIFENYMIYVCVDLWVNFYDLELMLNCILKYLICVGDIGMFVMEFFNYDFKVYVKKEIREFLNEIFKNIFKYISYNFIFLIGIFCFFKGLIGFFIGGDSNLLYLYMFFLIVIIGLVIIFLFIWMNFKMV